MMWLDHFQSAIMDGNLHAAGAVAISGAGSCKDRHGVNIKNRKTNINIDNNNLEVVIE